MAAKRRAAPPRTTGTIRRIKTLYRRWRHDREPLSESLWSKTLRTSEYASALTPSELQRLRRLTEQLLKKKSFEGVAGLSLNKTMRARIALHAAIPVLHLGLDVYSEWDSFIVYPGDFRVHDEYTDEFGVVHREIMDLCGQSLSQGPIVLSWEAIRNEDASPADHDLVIHECAHKLDLLNGGDANGFPSLPAGMNARGWARDFHEAYQHFCATHGQARVDPYAAEDPAEFFAVFTETFFTAPQLIQEDYPAVYDHLRKYFRQDPWRVLARAAS